MPFNARRRSNRGEREKAKRNEVKQEEEEEEGGAFPERDGMIFASCDNTLD